MFKKKKVDERTYHDKEFTRLWNEVNAWAITKTVRDSLATKLAIDLYPEGADKEAEQRHHDKLKKVLLAHIGRYDTQLAILRQFKQQYGDKLQVTKTWDPTSFESSHEIVRNSIKTFFSK